MQTEKGFIVPLLVVVGLVVIAAVAYFHARPRQVAVVPVVSQTSSTNSTVTSSGGTVTYSQPTITQSSSGANFVQVTDQGTAAQRFNLQTFTNVAESYAVSFPRDWSVSGSGNSIFLTNGHSSVAIASQDIASGESATQFAAQSGATNGFNTKAANAYDGYEVISGNTSIYYLVNGSVGYKISVTDLGDTDTLRQILLTFTYTRAR